MTVWSPPVPLGSVWGAGPWRAPNPIPWMNDAGEARALSVLLCLIFKAEICTEAPAESHAVVKKSYRQVPCMFCPVSPKGSILQNYHMMSQSGYRDWYNSTTSSRLGTRVCVCLILCNFVIRVGLCFHHCSQDNEQFCPFKPKTTLSPPSYPCH